ncbi:MAG: 4-(cytidine 5'-diphospho)-2-C-methyl-D-erythritol kinase [Oscillospiraceae bacterium]|nr:4-(cytidine 5'-diphospho)-2-C-methyl-D-erythritol kinase [Oscillospiraceae bacterium]
MSITEMTLTANAKVNLYLDITGVRADGYHLLETVMQSVDLCDVVTVSLGGDGIRVECSNPEIPSGDGNICHKAAERFVRALGKPLSVGIHVEKRIPHGAGMGGGSTDAAAVIASLNTMCGNPLDDEDLLRIGAEVGADVPFCLRGGTQVCRGIGDELTEIAPFPERVFLVVKPDFVCDTRGGYARYDKALIPKYGKTSEFVKSGKRFPKMMYNVFQSVYNDERIEQIIGRLTDSGAEGAILTGSGSAVFGVFPNEQSARAAAREFPKYFTAVCRPAQKGIITVNSVLSTLFAL